MERIKLTDSMLDVMVKMSDGNPGAAITLMGIMENDTIDPDNIMGGLGVILSLDSYGIYGTDIYVLFNDICERSFVKMFAVLRACQLGIFPPDVLKTASHLQDRSGKDLVPVDELYKKVKEQLPNFDPNDEFTK